MNISLGVFVCLVCFLLGWMLLWRRQDGFSTKNENSPPEGENPHFPSQPV